MKWKTRRQQLVLLIRTCHSDTTDTFSLIGDNFCATAQDEFAKAYLHIYLKVYPSWTYIWGSIEGSLLKDQGKKVVSKSLQSKSVPSCFLCTSYTGLGIYLQKQLLTEAGRFLQVPIHLNWVFECTLKASNNMKIVKRCTLIAFMRANERGTFRK